MEKLPGADPLPRRSLSRRSGGAPAPGRGTTARRARASGSRLGMTRAAQAVLAVPETPTELQAGSRPDRQGPEAGLAEAGRAGLPEELARLEADLGAEDLLLEQGLAEQAARLQARTEARLSRRPGN